MGCLETRRPCLLGHGAVERGHGLGVINTMFNNSKVEGCLCCDASHDLNGEKELEMWENQGGGSVAFILRGRKS